MKCQVCWTYDGHHDDCELNNLQAENKRLREALKEAIERMDRARRLLTKGEPTLAHNWGILDVSSLRKALRGEDSNVYVYYVYKNTLLDLDRVFCPNCDTKYIVSPIIPGVQYQIICSKCRKNRDEILEGGSD